MTSERNNPRDLTLRANIAVHSQLAATGEYQRSPHFRPENKQRVRRVVENLLSQNPDLRGGRAIDFGCGTGFMIDLIKDFFSEVHGVDITTEMMRYADLSGGNIFLHECLAEQTPFPEAIFHFATAYSFMDHLHDYVDFLKEAFRVLKPGGILYADLNPNRAFIDAMLAVETSGSRLDSAIVAREIMGALHNGEYYERNFGLDKDTLEAAEPVKSVDRGFDAEQVARAASAVGFSAFSYEYNWYLGQARILHEVSPEAAATINDYLTSILPVSAGLYKYISFFFVK